MSHGVNMMSHDVTIMATMIHYET